MHYNTMTGNALSTAPQRPIADRLCGLQESITQLGESLNILEEGIKPILSNTPDISNDAPPSMAGSPLEAEVLRASERIIQLIDKVRSINSRNQL